MDTEFRNAIIKEPVIAVTAGVTIEIQRMTGSWSLPKADRDAGDRLWNRDGHQVGACNAERDLCGSAWAHA